MITTLRHFVVDTWVGRVIAFIIFITFVCLSGSFVGLSGGIGGMSGGDITKVGHYRITPEDLAQAIQQRVSFLQKDGFPMNELRSSIAQREVARDSLRDILMVKGAQLAGERSGVHPSDDLIRQVVFSMPEFRDEHGNFNSDKMEKFLRERGLTHQALIDQTTKILFFRATLFGLGQNITLPSAESDQIIRFYTQERVVDLVRLPFDVGQAPAQASEAQLKRFYDNHLQQFTKEEYRHIRVVTLLPDAIASLIEVPDDIVRGVYKQREREYNHPETRDLQVLNFSDSEKARKAADLWRSGTSWKKLKTVFPESIPASISDASLSDIPDDALARAAFSVKHEDIAKPVKPDISNARLSDISDDALEQFTFSAGHEDIVGPVKTAVGWGVVRITKIKPSHQITFDQARADIKKEIQKTEVPTLLSKRLEDFEAAISGSTDLEKIPSEIGAIPAAGSLDKHGLTASGVVAPLPGDDATRKAILKQAFSQKKGDLPHIVSLPNGGAFALVVDAIHPGGQKSFEEARTQVSLAWQASEKKRAQEIRATALYQQAKKTGLRNSLMGKSEENMMKKDEHFSRLRPRSDMPELIKRAALQQKVGQTAMLEDSGAFWLVHVTGTSSPSAAELSSINQRVEQQVQQGLQGDIIETLGKAYQREEPPRRINSKQMEQVSKKVFERILNSAG